MRVKKLHCGFGSGERHGRTQLGFAFLGPGAERHQLFHRHGVGVGFLAAEEQAPQVPSPSDAEPGADNVAEVLFTQ